MYRYLWNFLWMIHAPLGARIKIEKKPPQDNHVTTAGYYSYNSDISLFAKDPNEEVEKIIEILNHEVLHSILHNRIEGEAWTKLDNIHIWTKDNKRIIFLKVEEDILEVNVNG